MTSGNKEGLIKILNKEVEYFKNRPSQNPGNVSSSSSQIRILELRYPPMYNLPDFPNMVMQVLFESGRDTSSMLGKILDSNNIDDFISQLKDPVLKAVVCMAANQDNKALEILKQQIEAETKSISAHIIMASILAKQNQREQTILILGNIQSLTPDSATQQMVDGAIVSYALNMDFSQQPDKLEIARKAAMRLSQGQFSRSQYRDQLIQAMDYLGLKDEARLFAKKFTSITGNPSVMQQTGIQQGMIYQVTGGTQDLSTVQYNKIVELLQEDKKDPALRLLLTDLETVAGNSLLPERSYDNSNVNNRVSLVHAYQLEDKIIEMADPGPTSSVRKLLVFGRMCDLIGRQDKAKEIYEDILKKRPHEFGALLWLSFLYVDKEPNKAIEYLLAVDRRYLSQLGRQLSNYIQNNYYRDNLENTLNFASLAALFLDSLKYPDSLELSWAANIPMTLANSYSRDNIRLPQLYTESQSNAASQSGMMLRGGMYDVSSKDIEELAARRREAHNQFCKSMLRIPQLAPQGFAFLYAEAKARNAVDANMSTIALDALLKYQAYRGSYSSSGGLISTYNWGTGRDNKLTNPMEFLLYQNWKDGTLDELTEKVVPVLEKNNRMGEAKEMELLASLYKASPEDYVKQAKALVESDIISGGSSQYALITRQSALSQIIGIRSDRSLKVSLNQFLIDMLDVDNQSSLYQIQDFTRDYLTQLAHEDTESASEFLEKIVTIFLGPKEKRKEFISQNYNQPRTGTFQGVRYSGVSTNNERINICVNLLRNLAQNSDLLFTVLSQFEDFEGYLPDIRYYVQNSFDNVFQKALNGYSQSGVTQSDLTGFIDLLDESPFLADVNSFRTLPVAQLQKSSMFSYMMYRFWRDSSSQLKNFRTQLKDLLALRIQEGKLPQSFGSELLIAQLSENRNREVYDCLSRYWDKIQKLDPDKQEDISVMVCDTVGLMAAQDNTVSENIIPIINRLNELRCQAGLEKANAFLKNKQFEDFRVNESQFIENTTNLISSVASYDVNSGIEIFSRAGKIVEDARKRGQFNYSSSRDLTSRLIQRMQEDSRSMNFGSISFIVRLIRDTNEPSLSFEPYYVNQFEYPLSERFREYSSSMNNNQVEALKRLYNEIGPYLGKGNLAGLNIFRRVFDSGNWNEQAVNEAINWANEQVKSGDYPDLARTLGVFANFYKQQRFRGQPFLSGTPGNTGDNQISEVEQYYKDTITDANLSLQWRLMANYSLAQSFSSSISDDLVMQTIDLIIEGWSKYPNLNPEYCTNTIQRFLSLRFPERNRQAVIRGFSSSRGMVNTQTSIVDASRDTVPGDWEAAAARLADAYMAYRQPKPVAAIQPAGFGGRSSSMGFSGNSYNTNIQLTMLEINLILNRDDAVRTMLDSFDSNVGQYLDCWALLVKYNKPDILKSVIDKQWSNNTNQMGVVRFNKDIETNLPACLDVLQSPDIRYCAEVLISSLQDGSGNEPRPTLRRNERLKQLAEKFGEITFNSTPMKQRILEVFINDSQLLPLVSEYIAEEGKNINPLTLASNQNSNLIRTQSQLLAAYCVNNLLKGDPNAFTKTIQALAVYPSQNQPSGVRQVFEYIGRQLITSADTIQNNWTESQISSLATGISGLLSCSSQSYDPRRLISNLIVFDVLTNHEDEISGVMERCSPQIKQNLQYYQNLSDLIEHWEILRETEN